MISDNLLTPVHYFLQWEKETPSNIFLRQPVNGEWINYSYSKAGDEIRRIAAALRKLDLPPESKIAILSKNCAHWIMVDLAIMMAGHVTVPIYPTLSSSGVNQILIHSEAAAVIVGKLDLYDEQRKGIPEKLIRISFPRYGISDGLKWDDLLKNERLENFALPSPDKLATIMYSSGTTGTPKGVMLTFGALGYVGERVGKHLQMVTPERFFSYLPLSHIAERALVEMVVLASGSSISFTESLDKFPENLRDEQPTIFGGVPRIYQKFQEGVLKKMPQKKLNNLLKIPIVSSLIKKMIKKKLGLSKARLIVCGAAPTPVPLLEWFKSLGIEIREMYGMTENTAFSHSNYKKIKIGTVGQAFPEVEVKFGTEGEILTRHKALMTGYFKDAETTAKVFTSDGFLRTGDQGSVDEEGFLTITGRVKDQFKTDKAKFIAPAPIELKFLANTDIEQVIVVGMGIPQPIALIVLSEAAKSKTKEQIVDSLTLTLQKINPILETYERIEKAIIINRQLTIENGLLTPSLKVKRTEVEKIYVSRYPEWYNDQHLVIWE